MNIFSSLIKGLMLKMTFLPISAIPNSWQIGNVENFYSI